MINVEYLAISAVKEIILLQDFRPITIHFFSETRVLDAFLFTKRLHLCSQTDPVTQQYRVRSQSILSPLWSTGGDAHLPY